LERLRLVLLLRLGHSTLNKERIESGSANGFDFSQCKQATGLFVRALPGDVFRWQRLKVAVALRCFEHVPQANQRHVAGAGRTNGTQFVEGLLNMAGTDLVQSEMA